MLTIGSETKERNRFELVVQIRDNQGNPTGKKKSFITNKSEELELMWNRNGGKVKKKRKKSEAATSEQDIKVALKETETHVQKIRKARKLED